MSPYFTSKDRPHIFIKTVDVSLSKSWPNRPQNYFEISELFYINGILVESMDEKTN
jgi:hypothetical protein